MKYKTWYILLVVFFLFCRLSCKTVITENTIPDHGRVLKTLPDFMLNTFRGATGNDTLHIFGQQVEEIRNGDYRWLRFYLFPKDSLQATVSRMAESEDASFNISGSTVYLYKKDTLFKKMDLELHGEYYESEKDTIAFINLNDNFIEFGDSRDLIVLKQKESSYYLNFGGDDEWWFISFERREGKVHFTHSYIKNKTFIEKYVQSSVLKKKDSDNEYDDDYLLISPAENLEKILADKQFLTKFSWSIIDQKSLVNYHSLKLSAYSLLIAVGIGLVVFSGGRLVKAA